jgi:hypothetical protein
MSAVRQKKEFGGASPGVLTQVRKHANLGHPYGVATTSAAAFVHCFANLPGKSLARDDKFAKGRNNFVISTEAQRSGEICGFA